MLQMSGRAPTAGPCQSRLGLTSRELWTWSLLLAGVAYWANVVRTFPHGPTISLGSIGPSIISAGAFNVAAWVLIVAWIGRASPKGVATGRQIGTALAASLFCVVPSQQAIVGALFALGIGIVLSPRTHYSRKVAMLVFCLAMELMWRSVYLLPFHAMIATIDARFCDAILSLLGQSIQAHANQIENIRTGFAIEVLAPCASSFPLAGVCVAFFVTMLYCGRFPRSADLPWFALALVASILLTEARLSLMSMGEATYTWLHDGDGVAVYTLSALALAILFPVLAMGFSRTPLRMT
jgi:hypothetical protein